tara:strand:- start:48 stop:1055 length:1008 start_codon:yes stop_codon:yes gene_type:complete
MIKNLYNFINRHIYYFANKTSVENDLKKKMFGLAIETTNICNANCTFCAFQYQDRPTGFMDMKLFKKIIDEFVELGGVELGLTPCVGEVFADRLFIDRVKYAAKNIKRIGMYTNLISIAKFGLNNIIDSGLTDIAISTSAFDEENYKKVYRNNNYRKMYNNIIELTNLNNKKSTKVNITISARTNKSLKDFRNDKDYKNLIKIFPENKIFYRNTFDNWGGKISLDDLNQGMKLKNYSYQPRISPCSEFYSGPYIFYNGDVGICGCRDVNASELIIGNAGQNKIKDIWYNKKHLELLSNFMNKPEKICKKCSHYNNVSSYCDKKTLSYIKSLPDVY